MSGFPQQNYNYNSISNGTFTGFTRFYHLGNEVIPNYTPWQSQNQFLGSVAPQLPPPPVDLLPEATQQHVTNQIVSIPPPIELPPSHSVDQAPMYNGGGSMVAQNGDDSSVQRKRKRGKPWTEEEHKSFLRGMLIYGKGDWKRISRDFVPTKSPIQVASHAQKYFQHQTNSSLKKSKRKSIHNITLQDTDILPHSIDPQNSTPEIQQVHEMQQTQQAMLPLNLPNSLTHPMTGFGNFDNNFL